MVDLKTPQFPQLAMVRPPRFSNKTLIAQEAVFTVLVHGTADRNGPWSLPPIDELILTRLRERATKQLSMVSPVLRTLELPATEGGKVLRLLAGEFVSGTQMYPGLTGVVQGVRERALWDELIASPGD